MTTDQKVSGLNPDGVTSKPLSDERGFFIPLTQCQFSENDFTELLQKFLNLKF